MYKLDIQIDIAREIEEMDKKAFHQDLRKLLSKYFELNSIHIRKEIHRVEVESLHFREKTETEANQLPLSEPLIDIERKPLVTEFNPKIHQPALPQSQRDTKQGKNNSTSEDETLYY
ncbi:hypothetical protein SAMN05444487_102192 [Marininema mesophilum]|uniref:Uncharacterized protein n=1 Tax=Marininema mesophilum TaxID=1048340 RepID=A0A1H2SET3_9BACL|nr:hypothetical protein [Marininema mesophilum]SDW30075.1 hypothetical protein SAMN05444487_102192 [Marininema mesophilum]